MSTRKTVEYRIEQAIGSGNEVVWRNSGIIKGWSKKAVLRRAVTFVGMKDLMFYPHDVQKGEVYHEKHKWVLLRIVEVSRDN